MEALTITVAIAAVTAAAATATAPRLALLPRPPLPAGPHSALRPPSTSVSGRRNGGIIRRNDRPPERAKDGRRHDASTSPTIAADDGSDCSDCKDDRRVHDYSARRGIYISGKIDERAR